MKKESTRNVTAKKRQINEMVNRGQVHPGLDIIYAGAVAPNPAELVLNKKFDELIEKPKKRIRHRTCTHGRGNRISPAGRLFLLIPVLPEHIRPETGARLSRYFLR